jgi:hypothetical protein
MSVRAEWHVDPKGLSSGALGRASLITATAILAACGVGAKGDDNAQIPVEAGAEDLMERLVEHLEQSCGTGGESQSNCDAVIYIWSATMPLSERGIEQAVAAATRRGIRLLAVEAEDLAEVAARRARNHDTAAARVAEDLRAAGATVHYPALVPIHKGRVFGPAILGYKTAAAYEQALSRRFRRDRDTGQPALVPSSPARLRSSDDIPIPSRPSAYFRWAAGTSTVALTLEYGNGLLDMRTGVISPAPGEVDLTPSPDGAVFVAPSAYGLRFFDARRLLAGALDVAPVFRDSTMDDQYPSIGIISRAGTRTVYRVMTSWGEAVRYRDYAARTIDGVVAIEPAGPPVRPCAGQVVSMPVLADDGRRFGGRDERSGWTAIYSLGEGGSCEKELDLGVQTGKVAFDSMGEHIAFAIPAGVVSRRSSSGVFVYHLEADLMTRVSNGQRAARLVFPEFIGDSAVAFLYDDEDGVVLRRVCCLRHGANLTGVEPRGASPVQRPGRGRQQPETGDVGGS